MKLIRYSITSSDWTEDQSDISHLATTTQKKSSNADGRPPAKKVTMDDLWEDNWDDDVIESDFAHQLRFDMLLALTFFLDLTLTLALSCLPMDPRAELEKSKVAGGGPAPMQT